MGKLMGSRLPTMAFFHDNRFKYDAKGDTYLAATGYTNDLFERYLRNFSHISIVARREVAGDMVKAGHDIIDHPDVSFHCIDKLTVFSLFVGSDRKKIADAVSAAEVVVARLPSMVGVVAVLEARRQRKLYAIELVACRWDSLWYYGKLAYRFIAPFLHLVDKYLVWSAPNVLYVSQKFLQRRYPTRGRAAACSDVMLNPQSVALDDRLNKIGAMRSAHIYTLGTVAAVNMKYKGQQYVIRALRRLLDEGYRVRYRLGGSGDDTYLRSLAKSLGVEYSVTFLGPLSSTEVQGFMSSIDVYVQPSNAESHGRVILEAFEKACPAVGSSTGGIPELIDDDFVFERGDIDDLCRRLRAILDPQIMRAQAQRNYSESLRYDSEALESVRDTFYRGIYGQA